MPGLKKSSKAAAAAALSSSKIGDRGEAVTTPPAPPRHTSPRSSSALRSGRFGATQSSHNVDDSGGGADDYDPLLTLFRVHHNNRVQFDLGPTATTAAAGGSSKEHRAASPFSSSSNGNEKSKFNVKKFVRSSIFGGSSKSLLSKNKDGSFNSSYIDDVVDNDEDDAETNALIRKMLVPSVALTSPPKRISSFLKGSITRGGGNANKSNNKRELDRLEENFLMSSTSSSRRTSRGGQPPELPSSLSTSSSPKFTYAAIKNSHHLTSSSPSTSASPTKESKERIAKLLKKAHRSHKKSFRYRLAMRYYLLALKEMNASGYSDTHPLIVKVLKSLNDVHHAQSTLANSANIVRMGIQHEDSDQLIKALKMYTVAYRMRRDSLGVDHPSLPVLLNMMGSVQVKRGEYDEAMQILHLSLQGRPDENGGLGRDKDAFRKANPLTTSVTLRDIGMILEHRGNEEQALRFYHSSLRYAVKFRNEMKSNGVGSGGYGGLDDGFSTNGSNVSVTDDSEKDAGPAPASSKDDDDLDFLDQLAYSFSVDNGDGNDNNNNNGGVTTNNNHYQQEQENHHLFHLHDDEPFSLDEVRMAKTTMMEKAHKHLLFKKSSTTGGNDGGDGSSADDVAVGPLSEDECGEMELFVEKRFDKLDMRGEASPAASNDGSVKMFYYDELYVKSSSTLQKNGNYSNNNSPSSANGQGNKWEGADVDIAMTLHQIGQIHRRSLRYAAALSAYNASLRGMKEVLGSQHANIAAILGNIGNLYMEIGDYDEAFKIYQEVLGIETLHLGLSHPEVAVTLHNIATIECSRGNFAEGVSLYRQVVDMQKIRYGPQHITVAVTLSCLADANEKLGNTDGAIRTYEEALKIRMDVLGKSHIDVGRILHKLGRLASCRNDYRLANVYTMKAAEIYADNNLKQDHAFLREMARDMADIQAGLAFSGCKGIAL